MKITKYAHVTYSRECYMGEIIGRKTLMATTQPIRNKHQVRELADYFLRKGQLRNYVLIVLGVHTALRISDLLRLR